MIHNHHQKIRFRSLTDRLCCIVVKEIKILFNLILFFYVLYQIRIPLNFKTPSLTQPNRKFLAAKHPLGDVQHVQRGTLVVFPFVFAYRTSFHPDDKS